MKFLEFLKINLSLDAEDGNGDSGAGETPEVETPEQQEPQQQQEETPWSLKADDYANIKDEVDNFISNAKEQGYTEDETRKFLERRNNYISSEREKMPAELRAYDENIRNFINSATGEEAQVYAAMAENAIGRKILIEKIMGGNATPSIVGSGAGAGKMPQYDHKSFIDAYNEALDNKDKAAMKRLQDFANNSEDRFYRDFL